MLDLRKSGEEDEFLTYLEEPTVTIEKLREKSTLTDLFSEVPLSDELKKEIITLVDTRSNVAMGPGEIPIAVFLRDGRINTQDKNGDVIVGDLLIEIKMSSSSTGAQLASSNYSSRAKKEQLFKTRAGLELMAKYQTLDVKTGGPWPAMLASVSPSTDPEAKALVFKFLEEMYPDLFKSTEEIDWTDGPSINRSVGLALGMDLS